MITGLMRFALVLATETLVLPATAAPQQRKDSVARFYAGPARLGAVRGTVELANGANPTVRLAIVLRNSEAKPETLQIGFRGAPTTRVTLGGREAAQVTTLTPLAQRSGSATGTQGVTIDLGLEINGLPIASSIDTVDVRIVLPSGVPALIRSSVPATRDTSGGRVSYRLARQSAHLTTVNLVYAAGPVTLSIDKQIQPATIDRAGPVTVTLTILNLGRINARAIRLADSYDPRDFSGQGPDFQPYAGKENDRRLVWSRQLDSLAAGASTTVTYVLTALFPVANTSLNAATASISGELVGVSNKVWLAGKRR